MFSFCNASACARTRSATLQSSWSPNREHCSRPKWNRHCVLCDKEELCVRAGCIWQNQAMTCSVSRAEQLSRSSPFPHGVTWARRKESFTAEWIHTAQVAHFKASLTPYVYETQQLFESHAVTTVFPLFLPHSRNARWTEQKSRESRRLAGWPRPKPAATLNDHELRGLLK